MSDFQYWSPERSAELIGKQLAVIGREFGSGTDVRSRGIRERLKPAKAFHVTLQDTMQHYGQMPDSWTAD